MFCFRRLDALQHSIVNLMMMIMWISKFEEFQLDIAFAFVFQVVSFVDDRILEDQNNSKSALVVSSSKGVKVVTPLSSVCLGVSFLPLWWYCWRFLYWCCSCWSLKLSKEDVTEAQWATWSSAHIASRLATADPMFSCGLVSSVFDNGDFNGVGAVKVSVEVLKRSWRRGGQQAA